MPSIGGYRLKNIKTLRGHEGLGFVADLYKGVNLIAHLADYGDGSGVVATRSKEYDAESGYFGVILKDMQELLSKFKNKGTGALCETFLHSPYTAAEGFGELLLELSELENASKKLSKKTQEGLYYAVAMTGNSWFKNKISNYENHTLSISTDVCDLDLATTIALSTLKKRVEKYGEVVALAVLTGDFHWDLTFEDYAELHKVS